MRTIKILLIGGVILAILILGCSIKAPEVRITGEITALEKEVVGTYQQMEEDTWMVASTRKANREDEVKISSEKKKVLEALQEQKFNKDDVDEFKKKGYVGEDNEGQLEIRSSKELEKDPEKMRFVQEIVQEENKDREIIMKRVIELNDSLKKSRRKEILAVFARMNQENSPKHTWIQHPNGTWVKK